MKQDIDGVLRDKALGFYYKEEHCEYEKVDNKKYVFCKNSSRLYFGIGFLKVKILKIFSDSLKIYVKDSVKFFVPKRSSKKEYSKLFKKKFVEKIP